MLIYENECVGCKSEFGGHCLGSVCPNRNVPHYYCDRCGEETELYDFEGEQLCAECLLKNFTKIGNSC